MQGKHLSHALHGHAVPALKQGKRRRWRWAAVSIASVLAIMFVYTYIYCLASIVFNYAWWILFSSTVQSAHPSRATAMEGQALVPKIIHQTWRNETIPEKWSKASVACQQLHPGYEYMMWTDAKAEQLIRDKYPWFLDTYLAYSYNIQRADALRYFVLHEYGGIYLDLDIHCLKSLDFLRYFNFTAPKTYPIGLSNDIMVSRPGDPFALRLISNLKHWNRWFAVKYATVMFSTGPMFVTVQYALHNRKAEVAVLPAEIYGKYAKGGPEAAMLHLHGSSWHGKDARVVFWLEAYWLQLLVGGSFLVGGLAGWLHGRYGGARRGGGAVGASAVAGALGLGSGGSSGGGGLGGLRDGKVVGVVLSPRSAELKARHHEDV